MEDRIIQALNDRIQAVKLENTALQSATEGEACIKLLIIFRGFGGGKDGAKWQYLAARNRFVLHMPELPEFCPEGLAILREAISEIKPDIMIASSRGGEYAAALVQANEWMGPLFLISALHTSKLCTAHDGLLPILSAHGTKDGINSIERVRADVSISKTASLHEFEDGHDLGQLVTSGQFEPLLLTLHARTASDQAHSEWMDIHRPSWVTQELAPKLAADSSSQNFDFEKAKEAQKARVGLLSALRVVADPQD
jgi:hypothetical protein